MQMQLWPIFAEPFAWNMLFVDWPRTLVVALAALVVVVGFGVKFAATWTAGLDMYYCKVCLSLFGN